MKSRKITCINKSHKQTITRNLSYNSYILKKSTLNRMVLPAWDRNHFPVSIYY